MLNFHFLVYDSRSGSTFFSRHINNSNFNVIVTPEINLIYAVKLFNESPPSWPRLSKALKKGRLFTALDITPEDIRHLYQPKVKKMAFANLLNNVFLLYASRNSISDLHTVIFKKGNNLWVYDQIQKLLPESKLIFLQRDPRSIYESKKRTIRPYFPKENMAWAGVFGACLRWEKYHTHSKKWKSRKYLYQVKFEDFQENLDEIVEDLFEKLKIPNTSSFSYDYKVSEKERTIHAKAYKKNIDKTGALAWNKKLSKYEIYVIEFFLSTSMKESGYYLSKTTKSFRPDFLVFSVIDFLLRTIKHTLLTLKR